MSRPSDQHSDRARITRATIDSNRRGTVRTALRHLPVTTKIFATLSIILLLMGAAGVVATIQIARVSSDVRNVSENEVPLLRAAYEASSSAGELGALLAVYITNGEAADAEKILETRESLSRAARSLQSRLPSVQAAQISALAERIDSLSAVLAGPAADRDREALQAGLGQLARIRLQLNSVLDEQIRSHVERQIAAALTRAGDRSQAQLLVSGTFLILALLISAAAAERLSDEVNDPLRELVQAAGQMSTGHLDHRVKVDSSREFNDLGHSFNEMADRLERTVSEARASAQQADLANAAKSAFVSEVTHELRTPLTSLRASLVLLEQGGVDASSEPGKKMLRVAVNSTERLVRLINDRLDLDRIEAGQLLLNREAVAVLPLVDEALAGVQALAESRMVTLGVEGSSPPLFGDHDRLLQVLVNIVGNAVSFSAERDRVLVRVRDTGTHALIRVTDHGPGLSLEQQQSLFRPFTQAHLRRPGGTGLGLAIAKGIVLEHHGSIGVESEPGNGATFWFAIPLADTDHPVTPRRRTPTRSTLRGT